MLIGRLDGIAGILRGSTSLSVLPQDVRSAITKHTNGQVNPDNQQPQHRSQLAIPDRPAP